jgi:hypothetical protein
VSAPDVAPTARPCRKRAAKSRTVSARANTREPAAAGSGPGFPSRSRGTSRTCSRSSGDRTGRPGSRLPSGSRG